MLNVYFTSPPVYSLTHYSADELKGTWYEQKLQKTNASKHVYKIEKKKIKSKKNWWKDSIRSKMVGIP